MKRAPPNSAGAAAAAPGSGSSSRRSVAGGFSQVRIALSRGALKWSTPNAIFFSRTPAFFLFFFYLLFSSFFFVCSRRRLKLARCGSCIASGISGGWGGAHGSGWGQRLFFKFCALLLLFFTFNLGLVRYLLYYDFRIWIM